MKHIILFENFNQLNITKIIIQTAKQYMEENNCTLWDINNGLCEEFAYDIIEKMGGYNDNLYGLTGDMFFNIREDINDLKDMWGVDVVIETNYGGWSKKMLEYWGYPPYSDITKVDDEINHTWIYYNGKHYDAEIPEGTEKWYNIPLIKKLLDKYKK